MVVLGWTYRELGGRRWVSWFNGALVVALNFSKQQ
jgi:hypothetical protein